MTSHDRVFIRIQPGDSSAESEWTTEPADLHIYDYRFDEYDTEVVSLNSSFEHRSAIRDLDWEETHRKWTGETWKIDFAPLEGVVLHLLDHGFPLTVEPSVLRIYIADFDAPFLDTMIPSDAPPADVNADIDEQWRLSDFS